MTPNEVIEFFISHSSDEIEFGGVEDKLSPRPDIHVMLRIDKMLQDYIHGNPTEPIIRWHEHECLCLTREEEFDHICSKMDEKLCLEFIACGVDICMNDNETQVFTLVQ